MIDNVSIIGVSKAYPCRWCGDVARYASNNLPTPLIACPAHLKTLKKYTDRQTTLLSSGDFTIKGEK